MYVCVCAAVTERQIHQATLSGARTLQDLRESTGVAVECGRCVSCAKRCMREAMHSHESLLELEVA